jgi:hypothetical protein
VLASDINAIFDCLFANEDILDKLFSFLNKETPLNPLLGGYFANIVSTLISRRPDELFKYLEGKDVVTLLLKHLNTDSIVELLLKVSHVRVGAPCMCVACEHAHGNI